MPFKVIQGHNCTETRENFAKIDQDAPIINIVFHASLRQNAFAKINMSLPINRPRQDIF